MTVIESLRAYIQKFPHLDGKRLDIDCLSSKVDHYSVDNVPCESVVTRYLDGSSIRRCLFTLSSRTYHGTDIQQQAANMAFFEAFEEWLEQKAFFQQLPELGSKRKARSIAVTSSACPLIVDGDTGTARYQIQCELIYLQEV